MPRIIAAVGIVCLVSSPVALGDALVGLDMVFAMNHINPAVFDDFDDSMLGDEWQAFGNIGPEHGTALDMSATSRIYTELVAGPETNTLAFATLIPSLAFDSECTAMLFLNGESPDDMLGLGFTTESAFLMDETGLLGLIPVDMDNAEVLTLFTYEGGTNIVATVNGAVVYTGPNTLGVPHGVGVYVTPEPASAAVLLLGLAVLRWRRSHAVRP